jgi:heme-degrading monooxygenase HmoA
VRILFAFDVFEVSPDADEAFIAEWERARDALATEHGFIAAALYRAVRSDVEFRFVGVTRYTAPTGGLYEVVHEDGAPEGAGGVILVEPFEVAAEEDERFLTGWERAHAVLATQRGYLGTRLHRRVAARDFRFVSVARWSSPLAFFRALQQPDFQEAAATMPHASHPALYQVIRD